MGTRSSGTGRTWTPVAVGSRWKRSCWPTRGSCDQLRRRDDRCETGLHGAQRAGHRVVRLPPGRHHDQPPGADVLPAIRQLEQRQARRGQREHLPGLGRFDHPDPQRPAHRPDHEAARRHDAGLDEPWRRHARRPDRRRDLGGHRRQGQPAVRTPRRHVLLRPTGNGLPLHDAGDKRDRAVHPVHPGGHPGPGVGGPDHEGTAEPAGQPAHQPDQRRPARPQVAYGQRGGEPAERRRGQLRRARPVAADRGDQRHRRPATRAARPRRVPAEPGRTVRRHVVTGALGALTGVSTEPTVRASVALGPGGIMPLSPLVEPKLVRVVVDTHLHLPDMFELTFLDEDGNVLNDAGIKIGTAVQVSGGAPDSSSATELIEGEVTSIEAVCAELHILTVVRGYSKAHRLQRAKNTQTFVNQTDADIARKIALAAGLVPGTIDDPGVTHDHIAQVNQTDWDFLRQRAMENGYETGVSNGKFYFRKPSGPDPGGGGFGSSLMSSATSMLGGGPPTLTFKDNLAEFYPRLTAGNMTPNVEVRVWD